MLINQLAKKLVEEWGFSLTETGRQLGGLLLQLLKHFIGYINISLISQECPQEYDLS